MYFLDKEPFKKLKMMDIDESSLPMTFVKEEKVDDDVRDA